MNAHELALWTRIEGFSLDESSSQFPFSRRLARENRWPMERARRAIEEYKRFIFLGCAAGHPVSPSEDVDQVWHLHLAYSESYWNGLCRDVLGRPFHHRPTKGGAEESAKFEDWYGQTLVSYRRLFGVEPPRDVWPARAEHHELRWVDVRAHWLVPKPRWSAVAGGIGAGALFFAVGCAGQSVNVFNWRGPAFLTFFLWFSLGIFAAAFFLRRLLVLGLPSPEVSETNLHPFEVAYLAGGESLAVTAAVAGLMDRKIVEISPQTNASMNVLRPAETVVGLHPLEQALLEKGNGQGKVHMAQARRSARPVLDQMRRELIERGCLYEPAQTLQVILWPFLLAALAPVVGFIKVAIGVSRDRPVGILVAGSVLAFAAALFFLGWRPRRTPQGLKLLEELRSGNRELRTRQTMGYGVPSSALPLAVALYGVSVLGGTALAQQEPLLRRWSDRWTTSDGGSSDSGGSSSCGGGSSGCGGGGGGGGCGGCSSN